MVKRIVLWKIKDDQNKKNNSDLLREGLLSLKNIMSDILSLEVGLNYSDSDFDIVFIVAFNDPYMLKQFQIHPECVKVFQMAQSISVNMISCDYSFNDMSNGMSNNSTPINNDMNNNNILYNNKGSSNQNSLFNNMNNEIKRDTLATSVSTNDSAFSLPYGGNKNSENVPIGFNQNQSPNQGAYNGFGNMSPSKNGGVNFTVSENVNQIKFSNNQGSALNNSQSSEAWKCTKCGKTNSAFINMCSCGKRKPMDNMPAVQGMNPNNIDKRMLQSPQDSMMLNTGIVPKMPSNNPMGTNTPMQNGSMFNSPIGNNPMSNNAMGNNPMSNLPMNSSPINNGLMGNKQGNNNVGSWTCPSCGKTNNDMMKICVCGHRKVESNSNAGIPAYNGNNNNNLNNNNQNININKSMMMSLPKNPGANNVKSPNNNDFFNSFGNNNNKNNNGNNSSNRGSMGNNQMGNSPMGSSPMNGSPMGGSPMGGPQNGMNKRPNMMGGNGRPTPPPNGMNMPPNNMGGPMNNNRMGGPPFGGGNRPTPPPNNKNMSGNLPPDSWKCPRCGKVLGNFVGQCICGQRKPSRTNMHFN